MYLASKTVYYKRYSDFLSLTISIYQWKDLFIDFVTSLLISADSKGDNYDLILVIIKKLIKIVYYKLVKITINILSLVKVIINIVVRHYGVLGSIIMDQSLLFISKFLSLLYYFLAIKKKLSIAFYPQTNG